MAVPTYDQFVEPILRFLADHPDGATARDVHEAAARVLQVSDTDRAEILPSGVQLVYKNRAGWAHDRLKRAGLSASRRRGHWQLTDAGVAFTKAQPSPLPATVLESILREFNDVRLRPLGDDMPTAVSQPTGADGVTVSPDDRLEQALAELREGVATDLLELLSQVSPAYFETVVLDLLHKLGYGTSRADLLRVGRSGDGGI
ncbi:MAG: winged helix-turn-helix domain-containing protein, partial [Acidobacteriota bacterium]|nr:winged helix-turn-helix domain-containing protein [Acidobacteriota bacterium]